MKVHQGPPRALTTRMGELVQVFIGATATEKWHMLLYQPNGAKVTTCSMS